LRVELAERRRDGVEQREDGGRAQQGAGLRAGKQPQRQGTPLHGGGSGLAHRRHRVPFSAYSAISSMFSWSTNAGPVSTGSVPPPLVLPLFTYSHSASTARYPWR